MDDISLKNVSLELSFEEQGQLYGNFWFYILII